MLGLGIVVISKPHRFFQALVDFKSELEDDPIIKCHMESLYDTMLEQNLERIIEPYVKVQVITNPSLLFFV